MGTVCGLATRHGLRETGGRRRPERARAGWGRVGPGGARRVSWNGRPSCCLSSEKRLSGWLFCASWNRRLLLMMRNHKLRKWRWFAPHSKLHVAVSRARRMEACGARGALP